MTQRLKQNWQCLAVTLGLLAWFAVYGWLYPADAFVVQRGSGWSSVTTSGWTDPYASKICWQSKLNATNAQGKWTSVRGPAVGIPKNSPTLAADWTSFDGVDDGLNFISIPSTTTNVLACIWAKANILMTGGNVDFVMTKYVTYYQITKETYVSGTAKWSHQDFDSVAANFAQDTNVWHMMSVYYDVRTQRMWQWHDLAAGYANRDPAETIVSTTNTWIGCWWPSSAASWNGQICRVVWYTNLFNAGLAGEIVTNRVTYTHPTNDTEVIP
jgi:hypothetical protein